MDGSVENAYFGRLVNGWIDTELFVGWLANHFSVFATHCPVLLLVDGHGSHIDLHVSKFCQDNNIVLYCLPPHTSTLTQPLDVGFFCALKTSWGKACENYKLQNPNTMFTKYGFARVFKEAWIGCVKMETFVNSFKKAGICPFNRDAIDKSKISPSTGEVQCPKSSSKEHVLNVVESLMKPEIVQLYATRYSEGYDVEEDEMYSLWISLMKLTLSDDQTSVQPPLPLREQKISSALEPPPNSKSGSKTTLEMPKHFNR